jgi:hypothetical protein
LYCSQQFEIGYTCRPVQKGNHKTVLSNADIEGCVTIENFSAMKFTVTALTLLPVCLITLNSFFTVINAGFARFSG